MNTFFYALRSAWDILLRSGDAFYTVGETSYVRCVDTVAAELQLLAALGMPVGASLELLRRESSDFGDR